MAPRMLLSEHAALHRRRPGQNDPGQPGQNAPEIGPSDAKQYYDIYQQATGGPSSTEQLFGGDSGGLLNSMLFGTGSTLPNFGGALGTGMTASGAAPAAMNIGGPATSIAGAGSIVPASGAGAAPAMDIGASSGLFGGKGAGAGGGGAGAGGSAMGALGGLGALAAAAYMGYQQGEATQDRWAEEFANDPNAQAGKAFAKSHPEAFTNEGVPKDKALPETIPFFSSMRFNPETRRYEMKDTGMSMADFNAADERRRQRERGD